MDSEWNIIQQPHCRLCKAVGGDLHSIDSFVDVVAEIMSLHITANDKLSKLVCGTCTKNLEGWYEFKKTCHRNQTTIQMHESTDEETIQVKEEVIEDEDIEISNENVNVKLEKVDRETHEMALTSGGSLEKSINDPCKNKAEFNEPSMGAHAVDTQESPTINNVRSTPEESNCVKIKFVSGLGLVEKDATTIEMENLSAIEISYLQKCKAMADMYHSYKCACHLATHPNLKGLLSHLRSVKIWFPAFTCYNCMITFTDSAVFRKHIYVCPKNNLEGLVQLSEMKKRSRFKARVYQNYRCIKCRNIFTFIEDFCKHICVGHCDDSCMVEYHCDICKTASKTLQEFITHAQHRHDNSEGFTLLQENKCPKRARQEVDPKDISECSRKKRSPICSGPASNDQIHVEDQSDPQYSRSPKYTSPSKCPECPKVYSCRGNMLRHLRKHKNVDQGTTETQNPVISFYRCPDCLEIYSAAEWESHKQSHQNMNCSECGKVFLFRTELEKHRGYHSEQKVYTDSEPPSYKRTMLSSDPELPYCDTSSIPSENIEVLKNHKFSHDHLKDEGVLIESKYSCVTCNRNFPNYAEYSNHNAKLHTNRKMTDNEASRHSDGSVEMMTSGSEFTTPKAIYSRQKDLSTSRSSNRLISSSLRQKSKSLSEKPEWKPYHTCEQCLKVFSNKYNLKRHMKIHGTKMNTSQTSESPKISSCDSRPLTFANMQTPKAHIDEKHNHLPDSVEKMKDECHLFTCDRCNETFTTRVELIQHKVRKHAQGSRSSTKYKKHCKYCTLPFETLKSLNDHIVQVHSKLPSMVNTPKMGRNKKFPCKLCKKSFISKSALHAHVGCHKRSNEEPVTSSAKKNKKQSDMKNEFECTICGQNVPNDIALKIHGIEKHGNAAGLLIPRCESCNQDFETLTEYENHKKLHEIIETQEKQNSTFSCQFYAKSSSKNKSLQAHIEISHPTIAQKFECQYCEKKFDKKVSLNKHLKAHEKKKLSVGATIHFFNCSICNLAFNDSNELRRHTASAHTF